MKLFAKRIYVVLSFVVVIICILILTYSQKNRVYETNSIYDYGMYVGNYDNDTPSSFINSFFPSELNESFSAIEYHYKAKRFDTYSYEVYLDFCIEDTVTFHEYLRSIQACYEVPTIFTYDNTFEEYSISNVYSIASNMEITGEPTYRILNAQVGKILISQADQRIIYVAIGLHDGGGTNTSELCYFFDKFNINPCEYAKSSYNSVFEEQKESMN